MGLERRVIVLVVLLLSFVLPAGLCLGLALASVSSLHALAFVALAASAWMALVLLVNWWEFTTSWLRPAWALALIAVAWHRATHLPELDTAPLSAPLAVALALSAALALWLISGALAARRHEGRAIELEFPLRDGRFLVTDGGDGAKSVLVNYHYGFRTHRASGAGASMRYAMDVVQVGSVGGEARGFLPRENAAYRIWDRPLHAPCDGVVAHVVDEVADNSAFGHDRPYGVGNHVVIRAVGETYIVLGHLRQGSVRVHAGDAVKAGDEVGRVGNSGWTERPHLHLQAMRSASGDWWHGTALPMRFHGRFPVRNQTIRG